MYKNVDKGVLVLGSQKFLLPNGSEILFSPTETTIFSTLAVAEGSMVPNRKLLSEIYGRYGCSTCVESRSMDVMIHRVRAKLTNTGVELKRRQGQGSWLVSKIPIQIVQNIEDVRI